MVALVRGVHGLRGAVRVEVLTDRPEERYAPGHGAASRRRRGAADHRFGRGRRRRSRLAAALSRGHGSSRGRRPPRRLPGDGPLSAAGSRSRRVLLARGDRLRSSRRGRGGAGDGARRLPRRRDRGVRGGRRAVRRAWTCPPCGPSSGCSPPGAARSSSTRRRSIYSPCAMSQPRGSDRRHRVAGHDDGRQPRRPVSRSEPREPDPREPDPTGP